MALVLDLVRYSSVFICKRCSIVLPMFRNPFSSFFTFGKKKAPTAIDVVNDDEQVEGALVDFNGSAEIAGIDMDVVRRLAEQATYSKDRMKDKLGGDTPTLGHLAAVLRYCIDKEDERRVNESPINTSILKVANANEVNISELRHFLHIANVAYENRALKDKQKEDTRNKSLSMLEYRFLFGRNIAEQCKPAYFVAYSATRNTLVLSIRGTDSKADLVTDILTGSSHTFLCAHKFTSLT